MILHAIDPNAPRMLPRRYRPQLVRTLCHRAVDRVRIAGPSETVTCTMCAERVDNLASK